MIALIYSLCILLFLPFGILSAKEYESPEYTRHVAEITRQFATKMKKEFNLDCEGSGGSMPYDVEEISLMFAAYQRATVEQARELEVKLIEEYLKIINNHEKIRPFLNEYPFPAERVTMKIRFLNKNKRPYKDGSVSFVFQANNRIYYDAENLSNPYSFTRIQDEPYETAYNLVFNPPAQSEIEQPK